jgi:hypothetical protein
MTELRILILDTETNGLPANRYAPISTPGAYPAVLQISWGIYTVSGRIMTPVKRRTVNIALHPSIPWDAGAARIHGITEEQARTGTPGPIAFTEFAADLSTTDVIIAHNLAFDKPVIRAAAYVEADRDVSAGRRGSSALRHIWPATEHVQEFCSMRETTALLGLVSPQTGRPKPPRLIELYEWIYGHPYTILGSSLHNSRNDTDCLERCIYMLLRRGQLVVSGRRLTLAV